MSYTPGPWVVAFSAGTPDGVCLVRNLHNFEAFTEADARLIACAPEMAELLERLLNEALVTAGEPVWDAARALLARIQGEADVRE